MSATEITIIGADGTRLDVSGPQAGRQGIVLAAGQVQGIYDAPTTTESRSAARAIGGKHIGTDYEIRDLILGFHLFGEDDPRGYEWLESTLSKCFTYEPDPWDPTEKLARIFVKSKRDTRVLNVQKSEAPDFQPDMDPNVEDYANVRYLLRAYEPMWASKKTVTSWETSGSSGTGLIAVSNPTDRPMLHTWVLTRGTWTIPDFSWRGPKGNRAPGGEFTDRKLTLLPIDSVHGGARINLDPMKLMVESWSGTNLLAELAGQQYFMHEIPPYTPETLLPIKVTGAPPGGARAELHQPRMWSKPWGLQWR